MRGWWRDLTDLVLPAECGGCGMPRTVLCPECRAALSGAVPSRVRPVPEPSGLPATYAAVPYADEVRAVLLAHKERGSLALAGPLGAALAGAVRAGLRECRVRGHGAVTGQGGGLAGQRGRLAGLDGDWVPGLGEPREESDEGSEGEWGDWAEEVAAGVQQAPAGRHGPVVGDVRFRSGAEAPVLLVPVPSARGVVRARGHDPARRIALAAAGELRRSGTPARVVAVLRQRRWVADQSGLNSRQRLDNLAGALEVVAGGARLLVGGPVVLVDDLMTTGASLREAARAVREAITCDGPGGAVGAPAAVYAGVSREGRGEQMQASKEKGRHMALSAPGIVGVNGPGDLICAAVIAASPDSFEINRN
ncbi:ComF family protein [Streptomyces sp. W16]|uniref:ComF family protein n=1 Tax=Streptomyces sp. W16 TaxID=3076631 RepID=UPI00295B4401|nr:ComF family protein [Streptomyces sp. W16]MDV9175387.1 ComF family protein [Streptomyces sp. W16]